MTVIEYNRAMRWRTLITEADRTAKIFQNIGRQQEAQRFILVSDYCYTRYCKLMNVNPMLTKKQDRVYNVLGSITSILLIISIVILTYLKNHKI